MSNKYLLSVLLFFYSMFTLQGQIIEPLKQQIQKIISSKNAKVGVAIVGNKIEDTLTLNGDKHVPMQSVFKLHIALFLLSEIDKGKFTLNQKILIKKEELLPGLFSPLREKYPQGISLSIAEILEYMVSKSDNVACDVLLKLLGGPKEVENYFVKNNFKEINIRINEDEMQHNWDMQFLNWTTPKEANRVLISFFYNDKKNLSSKSHQFFWEVMKKTEKGKERLKGQLPSGTVVAHKTGYSGINKDGITAAVNDIGIVFRPNGKPFFISIFVINSKENDAVNEKIIADISKAAWDYFVKQDQKKKNP